MSQDTFPFAVGEEVGYDDPEAAAKKKKLIAAAVAGALVVGAAAYMLLGGGGAADEGDVFIPRAPRAASAAAPKAVGKTATAKKLPVAYQDQIGRDPFQALYVVPVAAPVAPVTTTTSTSSASNATDSTSTSTSTGSTASGTGTTPAAPTVTEHKLVLTRVYGTGDDRTAVYTIDGREQVAKIGTKFGPTSEILLLSFQQGPKAGQWTTVLQVGDGAPFDVVTGAVTYVR